jgi:hypothetical protein
MIDIRKSCNGKFKAKSPISQQSSSERFDQLSPVALKNLRIHYANPIMTGRQGRQYTYLLLDLLLMEH